MVPSILGIPFVHMHVVILSTLKWQFDTSGAPMRKFNDDL